MEAGCATKLFHCCGLCYYILCFKLIGDSYYNNTALDNNELMHVLYKPSCDCVTYNGNTLVGILFCFELVYMCI